VEPIRWFLCWIFADRPSPADIGDCSTFDDLCGRSSYDRVFHGDADPGALHVPTFYDLILSPINGRPVLPHRRLFRADEKAPIVLLAAVFSTTPATLI
jgi:hypothetical protein